PFYRALTTDSSYRVRDAIAQAAAGPLLYRVEALLPGGAAIGATPFERFEQAAGLARTRQAAGPVPTAAEPAALPRQPLAADQDAGISFDWKGGRPRLAGFRSG